PLMYYMLTHKEFKQRQMARDLGLPHGAIISGFVAWLESLGFVEKNRNLIDKVRTYIVRSPIELIRFYSTFRKMENFRLSLDIGENRDEVMEYFRKEKGVFCLTTALEHYTEYVKDPAIHVYVTDDFWNNMSTKKETGKVRVYLYLFRPYRDDNVVEMDGLKITSPIRTIIDLFCDDKAYTAEPLINETW
ncbi:MAG TPA: hypothetical protein VFM31_06340, partial [Nitrososphaeraceae archaeon]|nr:hypothetical protein [Nitrososphaeraceae archaeon]